MSRPVRIEVEAAGHVGHVFASRRPPGAAAAGPAVVLLHGIGASHRYLRRLHGLLAGSVDTYSMDSPASALPPGRGKR